MAVATVAPPAQQVATILFPTEAVATALRDELIEAVKAEAMIKGITLPTSAAAIGNATFQVDSLVAVSILCTVEPIIGFELPDSVVRSGGYGSVDEALAHLASRIQLQWTKRKGGKP